MAEEKLIFSDLFDNNDAGWTLSTKTTISGGEVKMCFETGYSAHTAYLDVAFSSNVWRIKSNMLIQAGEGNANTIAWLEIFSGASSHSANQKGHSTKWVRVDILSSTSHSYTTAQDLEIACDGSEITAKYGGVTAATKGTLSIGVPTRIQLRTSDGISGSNNNVWWYDIYAYETPKPSGGLLNWWFIKESIDKGKKYFKNKLWLPEPVTI